MHRERTQREIPNSKIGKLRSMQAVYEFLEHCGEAMEELNAGCVGGFELLDGRVLYA